MKRILLLALVVGFVLFTIETPMAMAQDDGAALLEQRCSVCHPSARPKSKQKTPEQWETTVTRMMGKGAQLTPEEKKRLIDHLSETYKP